MESSNFDTVLRKINDEMYEMENKDLGKLIFCYQISQK